MREKRGSLTYQVKQVFDSKLKIGESRHEAKISGEDREGIYSWSTYKTYLKHASYFAKYCKAEHGCKTIEECRKYADEWLMTRRELSAWTQKMEVAALCKLYGDTSESYIKTPDRHRADIVRSRGDAVRDKHFSEEKNKDLVQFCKATGLRRSELSKLTGDRLVYRDGEPYLSVTKGTKGGKPRLAPIIAESGLKSEIVAKMRACGESKVFDHVPVMADIHSYRADYATALYKQNEREFDEVKRSGDLYWCRRDKAGIWLDREAMRITSEALGHNRVDIIAGHYLR